jgi:hypothetical protein
MQAHFADDEAKRADRDRAECNAPATTRIVPCSRERRFVWGYDQHRSTGVLGNLVPEASLHELMDAGESARAEDDGGRADLVGDTDDASPRRRIEPSSSLGVETRLSGEVGSLVREHEGVSVRATIEIRGSRPCCGIGLRDERERTDVEDDGSATDVQRS